MQDFPGLFDEYGNRLCYLDSAATTHKPDMVLNALNAWSGKRYSNINRSVYDQSSVAVIAYNDVRGKVAAFIGASEDEIIFTSGTTDSINTVSISLSYSNLHHGKKSIFISLIDHHSNIMPWQKMASILGLEVRYIPFDAFGNVDLNSLESMMDLGVFLVAVHSVSNVTGNHADISSICQLAHKYGAMLFVDGAQHVSSYPINVYVCDVDFFVFSAHKMYGPNGVGVLYGKKCWLERMEPVRLGGGMINNWNDDGINFVPVPYKFEAGTPAVGEVIAFGKCLEWLSNMDINIKHVYSRLFNYLSELDVYILGRCDANQTIISFVFKDGTDSFDIAHMLNLRNVCVRSGDMCAKGAMRFFGVSSLIRLSIGIYNDFVDCSSFEAALSESVKYLRKHGKNS